MKEREKNRLMKVEQEKEEESGMDQIRIEMREEVLKWNIMQKVIFIYNSKVMIGL